MQNCVGLPEQAALPAARQVPAMEGMLKFDQAWTDLEEVALKKAILLHLQQCKWSLGFLPLHSASAHYTWFFIFETLHKKSETR